MANKTKPAKNKNNHSCHHCPSGYHYVREHLMHISPSNKHPKGIVVIRHAHCRKNIHSSKETQMKEKSKKSAWDMATEKDAKRSQHVPGTQKDQQSHIAPAAPGNGDDQDTFTIPNAEGITKLVQQVNPNGSLKLIALIDPAMLAKYEINTPARLAAFIAQISSETDFHSSKEAPTKEQAQEYDNNPRIGNRYRGRGLIQLTSKDNYIAIGNAIGVDLANNPELAIDDRYNFLIALEFWKDIKGNKLADKGNIDQITKRINGASVKKERLAKSRTRYKILKKYLDELR